MNDDRPFKLAAFLTCAAGAALTESPRYAATRMLAGAVRVIETFDAEDDEFLSELKAEINEGVVMVRADPVQLEVWINELTRKVGAEVISREKAGAVERPSEVGG